MSIEQEASSMGWVPQDKFKGDPERWVDAETFVQRGHEVMPILKKANEDLRRDVTTLRGEMTRTQQLLQEAQSSLTEFQKYHEEDSKRQFERAMEKLKGDKRAALQDNDVDAVMEIDDAISTLREQQATKKVAEKPAEPTKPAADPSQDPVFQDWLSANSNWYGRDAQQTMYANSIASFLRQTEPTLTGREFLDRVTEEVEAKYPSKEPVDRVEGSRGGSSRSSSGKTYADLPPDAKATCDKFGGRLVGEGKAFKDQAAWRKQYVKDYFGEA